MGRASSKVACKGQQESAGDARMTRRVILEISRPIVLLGPPGAGKGTQAREMSRQLRIPHISTGNMFRENVDQETVLGKLAKPILDGGALVSDDLVNDMVRERLRRRDCWRGFVLDGYPRT